MAGKVCCSKETGAFKEVAYRSKGLKHRASSSMEKDTKKIAHLCSCSVKVSLVFPLI